MRIAYRSEAKPPCTPPTPPPPLPDDGYFLCPFLYFPIPPSLPQHHQVTVQNTFDLNDSSNESFEQLLLSLKREIQGSTSNPFTIWNLITRFRYNTIKNLSTAMYFYSTG
ncbi:hypothetical protein M0804_012211 [Polistes exclamans]|nr:hypothetical protein M0804_012211 [Polistes exclamans]